MSKGHKTDREGACTYSTHAFWKEETMKKILIGVLIFGSVAAYGREVANDFLVRAHVGRVFTEFDDFEDDDITAYGGELEYLRGTVGKRARYGIGIGATRFDWDDDFDFMAYEAYLTAKCVHPSGFYAQLKAGWADGDEEAEDDFNRSKFEVSGPMVGLSYGREWENKLSFELGVKVYDIEKSVKGEDNIEDDAWQHYWYAGFGYRF